MRGLRIVLLLLLVLLAWLQYRLWFGNGGEREVSALRARVERQARDNDGLRQRNDALAAEVEEIGLLKAAVKNGSPSADVETPGRGESVVTESASVDVAPTPAEQSERSLATPMTG